MIDSFFRTGSRSRQIWRLAGTVLLLILATSPALADTLVIDDFDYADDAAAQAAWREGGGSPAVAMADAGSYK